MKATDDLEHADPLEPLEELFRDLRASSADPPRREPARRLEVPVRVRRLLAGVIRDDWGAGSTWAPGCTR